jgi:Bacterial conjugation TrbI-like protein
MRAVAMIVFAFAGVFAFPQNPAISGSDSVAAGAQEAVRAQNSAPSGQTALGQNGAGSLNPSAIQGGPIATGTEIRAVLDTPLSTRTARQGDRFTATVSQTVRGSDGSEAIPAGARIEGEVVDAEEGKGVSTAHGRGKLSMRFNDITLPGGQSVPFAATLISVHNTNGREAKSSDDESETISGARGKDMMKNTGADTGIGALTGLIFGTPLRGLAVGTLSGGGYVLSVKSKDVDLPAQTGMVIRLDQPFGGQSPGVR